MGCQPPPPSWCLGLASPGNGAGPKSPPVWPWGLFSPCWAPRSHNLSGATSPLAAASPTFSPTCSYIFTSHTAEPVEGTPCSCKNFYSIFILNSSYLTPLFIISCVNNFTPASSAAASSAPMVSAQPLTCPSGHVLGSKLGSGCELHAAGCPLGARAILLCPSHTGGTM